MNRKLLWQPKSYADPARGNPALGDLDQQADLAGPFWADIGPDPRQTPGGWSWTILDYGQDGGEVAFGFAPNQRAAKDAVDAWRPKPHVWRYDENPDTPRPWIVSYLGHDAEDFDTWDEAVAYANSLAADHPASHAGCDHDMPE